MATNDAERRDRPIAIAPAPANGVSSTGAAGNANSPQSVMAYSCQTCAKRKVKCDKVTPRCSSCRRSKLECFYLAPPQRSRKRKLSDDVLERLARYERILHQYGLLDVDKPASLNETATPPQEPIFLHWNESELSKADKLLTDQGKSRYIDSNLWRNLDDDEMQHLSDEEGPEDEESSSAVDGFASDPLTGAIMDSHKSLLQYHPSHTNAMALWQTHVENVEPLCKILHIPSTTAIVEMISQQPVTASKADECLLFAVYHFAVFTMAEDECARKLGESRTTLMHRYHFATRQALVNAAFLKTTEMSVLQALVLFLLPCRDYYDSHTFWILTGVAVRVGQRIGLHRDGEKLGLGPFEVQMRRRLFYQLLPLDARASQMSGARISIWPDAWDTLLPSNIDDDQIWPGMTAVPDEQKGATEMIFCLSRSCLGRYLVKVGKPPSGASSWQVNDYQEAEKLISQAESEVEETYLRYCDMVNPLHFLASCLARSGITAMRLRTKLPKVKNQTATKDERRELFLLAQKIIDADTATCTHPGLIKYRWHIQGFFLWGMWDALIFILVSLWRRNDLVSSTEAETAWKRVEQVFDNHHDLLESKRALYVAFGRLTLKAWDGHPPRNAIPEPAFINSLRRSQNLNNQKRAERRNGSKIEDMQSDSPSSSTRLLSTNDTNTSSDSVLGSMDLNITDGFNLNAEDWVFWDQLIHDHQAQND
jgi:hypothetical protein